MIYIPDDWLVDKANRERVYEIMKRHFFTDLVIEGEPDRAEAAATELRQIGENVIADKLESGGITFPFLA